MSIVLGNKYSVVFADSRYSQGTRPLHELKLSFKPGLSVLDFVWRLQASTAGSRDLVIDGQQAMTCIALTFHPGMICFELKSRSNQPRTRSLHAGSSNSQWQLTQTVRTQKEMVGCFNITASLDHLDYDCVVVVGSVHVLEQHVKWSFRHEIKAVVNCQWFYLLQVLSTKITTV